ncbi:MAG: sulfopyruvate decarboxylase subunit beta [Chloroflexi bacterium]|nr:sulfopyruvate decarboxylase subunit beta [Chloroflexota bacterium]
MFHTDDMFQAFEPHRGDSIVIVTGTSGRRWRNISSNEKRDLSFQGAMGQTTSAALGFALSQPEEKVVLFDSEGALLMNMGTIATIGREKPANLLVVVWDNEQWAQTGFQASHTAFNTDLEEVAQGCGIVKTATVWDEEELATVFAQALEEDGPWFIVAKIQEEDEYMPVSPVEPEMTLHRFRQTFLK